MTPASISVKEALSFINTTYSEYIIQNSLHESSYHFRKHHFHRENLA